MLEGLLKMTKPNFTVYHMQGSRSFRVVWLLEELGLPYSIESVGFDLGNAGGETYKDVHPLQKVPALIDGDLTMYESIAIMQYVLNRYGDGGFKPSIEDNDYAAYLQWLHFGESTLTPIVVDLMKQRRFFPKDKRNEYIVEQAEKEMSKQLAFLSDQIGDKDYILDRGFTAADISVGYCLLLARFAEAKVLFPENIKRYWKTLVSRPGWAAASDQPKY